MTAVVTTTPATPHGIRLRFGVALPATAPERLHLHRVAGHWLAAERPIAELEPFVRSGAVGPVPVQEATRWTPRPAPRRVYRGTAFTCGQLREVECLARPEGFELRVRGVASVAVSAGGGEVALLAREVASTSPLLAELLLGPGLILALALRGVFCLHASAVRHPLGVIALLGASGTGKSTLARHLALESPRRWPRVADDILPVALTADGLLALPHFPQLKLPSEGQYPGAAPERVPIRALVLLNPCRTDLAAPPELHPLQPLPAALALLQHTAAARLFDRPLASGHLDLCGHAAAAAPVLRLDYPFALAAIARTGEVLAGAAT